MNIEVCAGRAGVILSIDSGFSSIARFHRKKTKNDIEGL
jgi:hypothetical protein